MTLLPLHVTVTRGLEALLAGELRRLGARRVRLRRAGVACHGDLATALRLCLWSRLASRVLLVLAVGPAADAGELYATVAGVDWDDHLRPDGTLAVDFTGTNAAIRDSRFGARRVKDAIVDQLRARHGRRPTVDLAHPDVRVNVHLERDTATVCLDLSGDSLHRRGYRREGRQVAAPLKETLAAALLAFAGWADEAAAGASLCDPLCGSGTILVEAAWMAADVAPGLLRAEGAAGPGATSAFGFQRWLGHDEEVWAGLVAEARERRDAGLARLRAAQPQQVISGSDRDRRAVRLALECLARAGLAGLVRVEQRPLEEAAAPAARGLLATNAPYGRRLEPGTRDAAPAGRPRAGGGLAVYRLLGERLRLGFPGWPAVVLAGDRRQAHAVGLPVQRQMTVRNGPLTCVLSRYRPAPRPLARPGQGGTAAIPDATPAGVSAPATVQATRATPPAAQAAAPTATGAASDATAGVRQFAARLSRNLRHFGRRARREGLECYRVYDADLPDYNLVVELWRDWVLVHEYAAPPEVEPARAAARLEEALRVICDKTHVPRERVVLRRRERRRGGTHGLGAAGLPDDLLPVREDGLVYLVDLWHHLDTGLFLDQRETRRLVRRLAPGARFLNLFAYTGTMTVNALAAGAVASDTVDLSRTALAWAARNLAANGFTVAAPRPLHRLLRADCLRWVSEAQGEYDLIWLDPPTYSSSKGMRATFDVQRDHGDLVRLVVRRLLAPGGVLLFSSSRQGFRLDTAALAGLRVRDLSRATLAFDCRRSAARHHVYLISRG